MTMDESGSVPLPVPAAIAAPLIPTMPDAFVADDGLAASGVLEDVGPLAPPPPAPPLPAPTTLPPPAAPASPTQTDSRLELPEATGQCSLTMSEPSICFDDVFHELKSWKEQQEQQQQQQNSLAGGGGGGSLAIPLSDPALHRIVDALTSSSVESLLSKRWNDQLANLRAYKAQHGNCDVPEYHPTLGSWVARQRAHYKLAEKNARGSVLGAGPLTPERFERLRGVGLTVNRWEKRLEELRAYKLEHGHCDVPIEHPGLLGVWVLNQRDAYYFEREDMSTDRIAALESLDFNWNRWGRKRLKTREDAWDKQFGLLVEYIKVHGHSNISQHDKENERLGKWVKNQRYEYRKYQNKGLGPSRLGRDRIDKLDEIGFQWRLRPEKIPWEDRFKALVKFKEEHGHCRVPININGSNPANVNGLGKWAKYQRDQYCIFMRGNKKAKINQQKIDKLLSIGFEDSLEERVALGLGGEGEDGVTDENEEMAMAMGVGPEEEGRAVAIQQYHPQNVSKELPHIHGPPRQEEITNGMVAYHHHGEQHDAAQAGQPVPIGEQHDATAGQPVTYEQYHHTEPPGHANVDAQHQGQSGAPFHYQHGSVFYG